MGLFDVFCNYKKDYFFSQISYQVMYEKYCNEILNRSDSSSFSNEAFMVLRF
jgi:hypothetical protein